MYSKVEKTKRNDSNIVKQKSRVINNSLVQEKDDEISNPGLMDNRKEDARLRTLQDKIDSHQKTVIQNQSRIDLELNHETLNSKNIDTSKKNIIQRQLRNVRVDNDTYISAVHDKIVYHLLVWPESDSDLQTEIEKAKAFASVGTSKEERMGLLFQYVEEYIPKSEEERDKLYEDSGKTDVAGNKIFEATLGTCLKRAAACRELSAFLQLLLADEGVKADINVGTVSGRSESGKQRHAWLQTGDNAIDPTSGYIFEDKPQLYKTEKVAAISSPIVKSEFNFNRFQEAAYNKKKRSGFNKKFGIGAPTLRENAESELDNLNKKRDSLLIQIFKFIESSKILMNLNSEGVFEWEVIREKSYMELRDEIVPLLKKMSQWP